VCVIGCGDSSGSSDSALGGVFPTPAATAPPQAPAVLQVPTTVASGSFVVPQRARPAPGVRCDVDAGPIGLTRARCPGSPPEVGDCADEGLDCLYPATDGCVGRYECALGVWTPMGERCPGPEVLVPTQQALPQPEQPAPTPSGEPAALPSTSASTAPSDSGDPSGQLPPPVDAGAAPVSTDAGRADAASWVQAGDGEPTQLTPSSGDEQTDGGAWGVVVDASAAPDGTIEPTEMTQLADAATPLAESDGPCPALAPVPGTPCGPIVLLCSYGPKSDGMPTRASTCSCGRWYEIAPTVTR